MVNIRKSKFKNRETLMEASLNEFSEINYENASLNRIIKNAGVSKGSFYYHFKNKEDLYCHLLKESVNIKWAYINKYTSEHFADFKSMDIFDKFLYQAKAGVMFAREYPKYNKLANMFVGEKGTEIYDNIIKVIGRDSTELLKKMINVAYETGELDMSFDIEFLENLIEKLFSNYDNFFEDTGKLESNLNRLNEFVKFMKVGLKAKT